MSASRRSAPPSPSSRSGDFLDLATHPDFPDVPGPVVKLPCSVAPAGALAAPARWGAPLLHSLRCQREGDVTRVLQRVREMAVTENREIGMLERALRNNERVSRPTVGLDDEHLGRVGRVEIVVVATASEFPFQKLTDKQQLAVIDR